ncbi:MAG: hypothetical protein D6696_02645 [Acidobacteria bacterium]|nr:MAG: hypothetical protein D6696_02645 [Acidobacteriota bacterium]
MRSALLLVPLLLLGIVHGGCAALPQHADALAAVGSDAAAAAAYERWLAEHPRSPRRDRVLFRLALLYARPQGARHDPARAEELIGRLLAEHPDSPLRAPAELVRHLGRTVRWLRADLEVQRAQAALLAAENGDCRRRLSEAHAAGALQEAGEIERLDRQLEAERQACGRARRSLERLLAARDEQIAELNRALEALKRIDVGGD